RDTCRSTPLYPYSNDASPPALHPLSLHDALPIFAGRLQRSDDGDLIRVIKLQRRRGRALAAGAGAISVYSHAEHLSQIHQLVHLDRKSTRLNSSHVSISYAVVCLEKKKLHKAITA